MPREVLFNDLLQIREACAAVFILPVELLQRLDKQLIAEFLAQHVKQHQGFAVTHRFGRRTVSRGELAERKILGLRHDAASVQLRDIE